MSSSVSLFFWGPEAVPVKTAAESDDLTTVNLEQGAIMEARFSLSGRKPMVLRRMSVSAENIFVVNPTTSNKAIVRIFNIVLPFRSFCGKISNRSLKF